MCVNISANHVIQFSLVQNDEYGPQTVTPELRRETDISVQNGKELVEDD